MARRDIGWLTVAKLRRVIHAYHPAVPDITLWVDPGQSTGWAVWLVPPEVVSPERLQNFFILDGYETPPQFFSGQSPWIAACEDIYSLVGQFTTSVQVGWEDYILTPGNHHHDPHALKVIGFLEWLTQKYRREDGNMILAPQPSASRTLGTSGDKLKKLGWYRPNERDSNSAAAHLLSYLLREGQLPQSMLDTILGEQVESSGNR